MVCKKICIKTFTPCFFSDPTPDFPIEECIKETWKINFGLFLVLVIKIKDEEKLLARCKQEEIQNKKMEK